MLVNNCWDFMIWVTKGYTTVPYPPEGSSVATSRTGSAIRCIVSVLLSPVPLQGQAAVYLSASPVGLLPYFYTVVRPRRPGKCLGRTPRLVVTMTRQWLQQRLPLVAPTARLVHQRVTGAGRHYVRLLAPSSRLSGTLSSGRMTLGQRDVRHAAVPLLPSGWMNLIRQYRALRHTRLLAGVPRMRATRTHATGCATAVVATSLIGWQLWLPWGCSQLSACSEHLESAGEIFRSLVSFGMRMMSVATSSSGVRALECLSCPTVRASESGSACWWRIVGNAHDHWCACARGCMATPMQSGEVLCLRGGMFVPLYQRWRRRCRECDVIIWGSNGIDCAECRRLICQRCAGRFGCSRCGDPMCGTCSAFHQCASDTGDLVTHLRSGMQSYLHESTLHMVLRLH